MSKNFEEFMKMPSSSSMVKLALGVIAFVSFIGIACISAGGEQKSERQYIVPSSGLLKLDVPQSWSHEVRLPPELLYLMPTIAFKPELDDSFSVKITVFWNLRREEDFNSQEKLRHRIEQRGKDVLPGSEETVLTLQELHGISSVGYFFTVTDKALTDKTPEYGEYKYVTQGGLGVGDLRLIFTILTNTKDSEALTDALEMLKNAKQELK